MNHPSLDYRGPPPFRFTPNAGIKTSAAFSVSFKVIATVVVMACAAGFVQAWFAARTTAGTSGPVGGGWFIAGLLLLVYTWWHILQSATRIDSKGLHQTWVWDKHMELSELAYAKLIRVRGLEWLIAPRLYVRTLMGKFAVFYAASPDMVTEFDRLSKELKTFRNQR